MTGIAILSSAGGLDDRFVACFRRFYDNVFTKAFPDPNLRETFDSLLTYNDPALFGTADPHGFILLAVVETASGELQPVGGAFYEVYHGCRAVLLSYILVAPAARSQGTATALFGQIIETLRRTEATDPARGALLFAETEIDAGAGAPAEEAEATRRRIAFLEKIGLAGLDLDYVQPPLRPGLVHVFNLQLLALRDASAIQDSRVPARRIAAFLETFYGAIVGDGLSRDAILQETLARVRAQDAVALVPVGQPRSPARR